MLSCVVVCDAACDERSAGCGGSVEGRCVSDGGARVSRARRCMAAAAARAWGVGSGGVPRGSLGDAVPDAVGASYEVPAAMGRDGAGDPPRRCVC